jgi:HlyD family secretion protein
MDTAIPPHLLARKRNRYIQITIGVIVLLGLAMWLFRAFLRPSLSHLDITTAVVEKGDIDNTLTASGEVLPEFEEVLTSPINASIQNVLMDAGARVSAGQSIMTLDKSAMQTEYTKQQYQLDAKQNAIDKLKLDLAKSFYDLKSNNDIKKLRIDNLAAGVENAKRLFTAGGGTREDIEQAELNLKVAQLEKNQLENEIRNRQQTMQIEIKESQIAYDIDKNDLDELGRKLRLASIVSTRDGVVTWVNKNIGTTVREGESLARISDLGSFKVTGSISDNYLNLLRNGMGAIIRTGDSTVRGHVTNVYPSVANGIVTFDVAMEQQHNKELRANMKVDVYLVTETHRDVVRVANGPAFKGASPQDVFIVHDQMAERKSVHTGFSNFDYIELLDGVHPGDVIIISDMSDYKNAKTIAIQ